MSWKRNCGDKERCVAKPCFLLSETEFRNSIVELGMLLYLHSKYSFSRANNNKQKQDVKKEKTITTS